MMIRLIGPGGAGKSKTGSLLAERLGLAFVDLDQRFDATAGDISKYIESQGYDAYATRNVRIYADLLPEAEGAVAVLLPSLAFETCVAETVRRQRRRPFSRSAEREEQVIRARFAAYRDVPAAKVSTMRPVTDVVEELALRVDREPAGFGHFASE